jgi:hypothetical protein
VNGFVSNTGVTLGAVTARAGRRCLRGGDTKPVSSSSTSAHCCAFIAIWRTIGGGVMLAMLDTEALRNSDFLPEGTHIAPIVVLSKVAVVLSNPAYAVDVDARVRGL